MAEPERVGASSTSTQCSAKSLRAALWEWAERRREEHRQALDEVMRLPRDR